MQIENYFILFLFCFPLLLYAQKEKDTILTIDSVAINYHSKRISRADNTTLSIEEVKFAPKFLGFSDPLKALKYLPGFGNSGDANASVYFRGMGFGHNGYYFNGIQIHNPTHFLGLFPVFNAEVVKDVKVFQTVPRGNFYGKVSSYIDIQSDWEIRDTMSYNVDASLFHIGAGFRKEHDKKQMIQLQVRKTFMNQMLWPYVKKIVTKSDAINYDLYDVNLHVKRDFGRQQLKFIFYKGQDAASLNMYDDNVQNNVRWGNTIAGLDHNLILNDDLKLISRVSNSLYNVNVQLNLLSDDLDFSNRQNSTVISNVLNWEKDKINIETGYSVSLETIKPENQTIAQNNANSIIEPSRDLHFRYFTTLKKNWMENWTSIFLLSYNNYKNLRPRKDNSIQFIEPHLKLIYTRSPLLSLYTSYSTTYQPIHHIPLTNISIPVDLWLPTDNNIRPMKMHQIVGGVKYSKNN